MSATLYLAAAGFVFVLIVAAAGIRDRHQRARRVRSGR